MGCKQYLHTGNNCEQFLIPVGYWPVSHNNIKRLHQLTQWSKLVYLSISLKVILDSKLKSSNQIIKF